MELATVIIAALGLFFAAIAAWGAAEAVAMTREMQRDATVRCFIEALLSIVHLCNALEQLHPQQVAAHESLRARFQDAQLQLSRCGAVPFPMVGAPEDGQELFDLLSSLTGYESEPWKQPEESRTAAVRSADLIRELVVAPVSMWWRRPAALLHRRQ
jgi:hypothetical protein